MADNEERLLQELTEKQTLLARMQLQLATLEKLVSDNTLRISTGNFPSSSSTSSAVDSYEDFDPAAAETAGDELAMLEYLEQLEQQRRDVVQLLNSTARKSQQSDSYSYTASEQRSNVRVRNETRQFGTTQSKAAPSYNGYAVGSCSGENDDGGNNSRVKLLDLHSSVQEHIEANLTQLYLLEKYSRSVEMSQHFSAHESADELKTRLVSLFRIKDEVEEMLNYNSMQKPDDEMIGPDDVNLDLLPNRFRSRCSVSSAGEYETDIGKLRNRDAELAEMEFKLGQKQSISSENDDGLKEIMMDNLLQFVQSNSDDPYFVLNTFQLLCKIRPEHRNLFISSLASTVGQEADDFSSETVADDENYNENEAAKQTAGKPMSLATLRQFQRFTLEIIQQRYAVDDDAFKKLEQMVEQLILSYIGLDAGEFMDEMLDGLNEILATIDLVPRLNIVKAERSFQKESEMPSFVPGGNEGDGQQQQTEQPEWEEMPNSDGITVDAPIPSDNVNQTVDGAEASSSINWVSAAQTAEVELDEDDKCTSPSRQSNVAAATTAALDTKRSLSIEQLRDLRQQVEEELAQDDFEQS